jgi:hypothetical protein
MTNKNCLNCEKELMDKYCSGCGQKADTHRISLKNFIFHDILHGAFHLEKGILLTAKEALTRPGKAALDYISGKRIRYYNVFYLILITIGLIIFLHHFNDVLYLSQGGKITQDAPNLNEASKTLDRIFSEKSKIIIFLFVPFAALNSFILFRRKKLNLSEHAIIAGMILLGMLLISAFGNLFFYFDLIIRFSDTFANIMSWLVTSLVILQIGFGYFNAFGSDYSKLGITYRILLFFALICLEIAILFFIVFGFVTNWKFGAVNISPF